MSQLTDLVRQKYPGQYDDLPDDQLEKSVLEKYPEYQDLAGPKKESWLRNTWNKINTPLVQPTPELQRGMAVFKQEHPWLGTLGELGTGLMYGQTSPLGLGLMATGGAAGLAEQGAARGLVNPAIAKGLQLPGKVAGYGMAAQGGINLLNAKTGPERLSALTEGALGIAGARHFGNVELKSKAPLKVPGEAYTRFLREYEDTPKELPPAPADAPVGPFVAGEAGVAKVGQTYPMDTGPVNPTPGMAGSGTILPREYGEVNQIPADLAARHGLELGKPIDHLVETFEYDKNGNLIRVPPEEPSFARTESGGIKIGADVKSLGKMLGKSLYSGDIGAITTKELLQNSIDATRHLGKDARIHVEVGDIPKGLSSKGVEEPPSKYVQVSDNGKGMTLDELHSVFSDLGASGKREDVSASGGFGLAKAAPLLGGESVEVTSVVNENGTKYRHYFTGTPDELLEGVNIQSGVVPKDTQTGTTVKTYLPEDAYTYKAKQKAIDVAENSPASEGEISINRKWMKNHEGTPEEINKVNLEGAKTTTIKTPAGDVDIIVPQDAKVGKSIGVKYEILNNGMHQASERLGYDEIPVGIPDKILVNVKPSVAEGHNDYPFTASREQLRGSVQEAVNKYLQSTIVDPAMQHRRGELKQVYEGMQQIPTISAGRKVYMYDTGKRFTPDELNQVVNSKSIQDIGTHLSNATDAILARLPESVAQKLEKIGLIFDDSLHGVNIPNPGEGKQAILMNPFSHMIQSELPEDAASGMSHTLLHELAHIEARGHNDQFTTELGKMYATAGQVNTRQFEDAITNAIADPTDRTQYNPELQELLQKYTESRGRPETYKDPLIGTGVKQENNFPDRKKQIPIDRIPDAEGAITESAGKLLNALKSGGIARASQDALTSVERGKRAAAIEGVKTPGLAGYYQQLGMLKGPMPKEQMASLLNENDVNTLMGAVTNSSLRPYEKLNAKSGLVSLMDGKPPKPYEIKLLSQVFGSQFEGEITNMFGGLGIIPGNWKNIISEGVNVPKSVMASVNFHAPLRQGLPLIHTLNYWKSLIPMFKSYGSSKFYDGLMESLKERPLYQLGEDAGLQLTRMGDEFSNKEEQFLSNIAEKLPPITAASRAYTGFLNKLRADTFDDLIADGKAAGVLDEKFVTDAAKYTNNATGRGSLGRFEKMSQELNWTFFSPRTIAARVQMFNPNYYINLSPAIRKEAIKSLFAVAGYSVATATLGKSIGATINTDPTSADFMKSKFGNTRIDPMGGFQQYVVLAARLLKATAHAQDMIPIAGRFVENKLSPVAAFADALARGNAAYQPKGIGHDVFPKNKPAAGMSNMFVPMIINDLYEVAKEDPDILPIAIPPAMFGATVNNYKTPVKGLRVSKITQLHP